MTNMSKKRDEVMVKTRHSSIEMADSEAIKEKKKQDMLTKARNKFFDALKSRNIEGDQKKSRTQATIDYLFKPCPNSNKNDKNQVISNAQAQQNGHGLKRASSLQKQHSVGSYPIKIDVTDDDDPHGISRQRPATVCVDKIQDEGRETAALALERPRKKLSFREPEIMGYAIQLNRETLPRKCGRKAFTPEMKRSFSNNVAMKKIPSVDLDDLDLESQAMRIVRTVGQAFEVCHKLSITAPETEHLDYDEQETLTQDLVSDRLSDVTSDKPKKDLISECASDKISLPDEKENSPTENKNNRSFHLDLLSPPSNPNNNNNSSRKSPMTSGESYASPHSDGFPAGGGTGSCNSSIPATTGSALSAHHEIQLLREQLEQQSQQTQAALAQLQLAREQLAAEQSARLEAQARTHQLLVHNRELLDHIAALVAHLQGGEKGTHQPQTSPHVTMPQVEPTSPQPSVDRLSVTFAEDSRKNELCEVTTANTSSVVMDKVNFPQQTDEENSDDEDYSASVTAIIRRRSSTHRAKKRMGRRTSSPFSPDIFPFTGNERRRSSCFTTSSGDSTAISIEDNFPSEVTQNHIFENIRLHKEVLSSVKMQPWPMSKKLRLVIQAKTYIKKHEGALQERLAKSRSTKDMIARWNIYLIKKWQRAKREAANLSNWVIPWELRIKEIESHFGSAVASYFTFLRWLFWVNLVTSIILIAFVAVPEMLTADQKAAGDRKLILQEDKYNATNFATLWDFEGIFKYSPLFYGWYTNRDASKKGYRLPLAYFMTGLSVYVYSFVATLRKMAKNSRMSKLSEKEDECIFSWKLFTAWDYMIGNAETAHNRVASIVMGFKEALLEEAEKKKDNKNWKIIALRVLVNITVVALLIMSAFAVVEVVRRSTEPEAKSNIWRMNEITVVMNLISFTFPIVFEILGLAEQYHPRKQLRIQLARIMLLNLLNIYSLIFALFDKIDDMQVELHGFKLNKPTERALVFNSDVQPKNKLESSDCYSVCGYEIPQLETSNLISSFLINVSTFTIPIMLNGSNITNSDLQNIIEVAIRSNFTNSSVEQNIDFGNDLFDMHGFETNRSDPIEDFQEAFQDYLNSVSSKFNVNINTTNGTDYNDSYTEKYDENVSYSTTIYSTNYEEFSEHLESTLVPIVNSTEDFDLRTEYNLRTENITSFRCSCEAFTPSNPNDTLVGTYLTEASYKSRSKLRSLCWETMFGQEIVKLTVMDFVMMIVSTLAMDFIRGVFVRVMNNCWCWDLEKKFPQYGDFKVAENILHLINNQGVVWMGMFFSPGLIVLNTFKLYVMVYFRSWAVLTCNVPHKVVFRASRSNNFYYALLLSMLFLCVLPVGYAIVWVRPSWHCGPFSQYAHIFHIFTTNLKRIAPKSLHKSLDYIASPGIVIPLLVLMILIIYYLISLTNALREANNDLKIQLRRERTEERRKMFQIVDRRRRIGSEGSTELGLTPFGKWKKLLPNLPSGKSFDDFSKQETIKSKEIKKDLTKGTELLSKFIKRALNKSLTSDEDSVQEATDTEQQQPLPDDSKQAKSQSKSRRHIALKMPNVTVHNTRKTSKSTRQTSTDSSEKCVKITENEPTQSRILSKQLELRKNERNQFCRSPSRNSKDFKQDSLSSTWSDNIPVITISNIESVEVLPEPHQHRNTEKRTIITENCEEKHKEKYVLKKQSFTEMEEDGVDNDLKYTSEPFACGKDHKTTNDESLIYSDTKTESSNDYKDIVLS